MYLEHFNLKELPFSLTPNTQFYCNLPGHQEALNTVLFALRSGDGFIKVTGEVGVGKTLLCCALMDKIKEEFDHLRLCYIPNPDLTPKGLCEMLATQLDVSYDANQAQHQIIHDIHEKLAENEANGKRLVLIIDEAQSLNFESLEMLRLLTNLETADKKLLHIILFAQPELDERLNQSDLRQLTQRITFSYRVPPISEKDLDLYLCHRLVSAGHTSGLLFSQAAKKQLLKASSGIPRIINILCHKAMLVAYGQGAQQINAKAVKDSISDSKEIVKTCRKNIISSKNMAIICFAGVMGLMISYMMVHAAMS